MACKHAWWNEAKGRFRGTNAFKRYEDTWSFRQLFQPRYYVQITYRQAAVRALGAQGGLGFSQGSRRFNAMTLSPHGEELAKALLGQRNIGGTGTLSACLVAWIGGNDARGRYDTVGRALSPWRTVEGGIPDAEGKLVLARLKARATGGPGAQADPAGRDRLLQVFEELGALRGEEPPLEELYQALEERDAMAQVARIKASVAFNAMYNHARGLVHACAMELDKREVDEAPMEEVAGWMVSALSRLADLIKEYESLAKVAGAEHADARTFCTTYREAEDLSHQLLAIVQREHNIIEFREDRRAVGQGPLFKARQDLEAEEDEEEVDAEDGLQSARLRQLLRLWRDCHGIG